MSENLELNLYEKFGFQYYGPFVKFFCNWVEEICEKENINNLLFCARDAYFYQIAFEQLFGEQHKNNYFYVSKKSLTLAIIGANADDEFIVNYIFANRGMLYEEILLQFGLNQEEIIDIIRSLDITPKQIMDRENKSDRELVMTTVRYVRSNFGEQIADQLRALKLYFGQVGFGGKIGLVDVGWRGSIQAGLELLANYFSLSVEIIGIYVGIDPGTRIQINRFYGYLYEGDKKRRTYYQLMSFVALFEMFGMAQHGTVLKYETTLNKIVKPICGQYEYCVGETFSVEHIGIMAIQSGALKYICSKSNGSGRKLMDKLSSPSEYYMNLFGKWRCSNCELRPIIYHSNFDTNIHCVALSKMTSDFKLSYWKTGYLYRYVLNGKMAFIIYVILKVIFG